LKIAFIQVQLIASLISSKKNICESVIVDITCGYATAIVEIAVLENIEFLGFLDIIPELNIGLIFQSKPSVIGRFLPAGSEQ
jgi:hypothetical protein